MSYPEGYFHSAPEPAEEPPFCDRCFGYHAHTAACPEDLADDEDDDDEEGRCEYCDRLDSECGARPCANAMLDEENDEVS